MNFALFSGSAMKTNVNTIVLFYSSFLLQDEFICESNYPRAICARSVDWYVRNGWNAAFPLRFYDRQPLRGMMSVLLGVPVNLYCHVVVFLFENIIYFADIP